jgi:UDP-2-acetamido-2,6-beta-L-arabino-hexul-4-ose reductase
VNILVTGADGFIGKNLVTHLNESDKFSVMSFTREDSISSLFNLVEKASAVIHLAGENRPIDVSKLSTVNINLTKTLCEAIRATGRKISLILSSSIQAEINNPYGKSKREAEDIVKQLAKEIGNSVYIYRLPNVFGKWCKPNYNSVVATFCYNIANNLPIHISDGSKNLKLVYVDDIVSDFISVIQRKAPGFSMITIEPEYSITLKKLADQINLFKNSRKKLITERVGSGLVRALYSTYLSYISPDQFAYGLSKNKDERGEFVEILKTKDSGQFSYFTAHPGAIRGGHYHHSKTEKFVVIKGSAKFSFKHIITNEQYEILTSGEIPQVVETAPGWAHNIQNVGENEMIVMLWANEIFNSKHPDTINYEI